MLESFGLYFVLKYRLNQLKELLVYVSSYTESMHVEIKTIFCEGEM